MVDDAQGRLPVVVQEPAIGPERAELQSEAAPVVVTAAAADFDQVGRRQAPVPGKVVLAGFGRQRRSPPRRPGGSSAVDIQRRTLQVGGEIVLRGARIEGGGVEELVAEQAGQLDQLSGIGVQEIEGEGMAQRMGRHRHTAEMGAPRQTG